MDLSEPTTAPPYISHDNVSFITVGCREPNHMFGPRRTHEQTPQYHANGAPLIACCFIIKGNLGPNGIHSTLCVGPTQTALRTNRSFLCLTSRKPFISPEIKHYSTLRARYHFSLFMLAFGWQWIFPWTVCFISFDLWFLVHILSYQYSQREKKKIALLKAKTCFVSSHQMRLR